MMQYMQTFTLIEKAFWEVYSEYRGLTKPRYENAQKYKTDSVYSLYSVNNSLEAFCTRRVPPRIRNSCGCIKEFV